MTTEDEDVEERGGADCVPDTLACLAESTPFSFIYVDILRHS